MTNNIRSSLFDTLNSLKDEMSEYTNKELVVRGIDSGLDHIVIGVDTYISIAEKENKKYFFNLLNHDVYNDILKVYLGREVQGRIDIYSKNDISSILMDGKYEGLVKNSLDEFKTDKGLDNHYFTVKNK